MGTCVRFDRFGDFNLSNELVRTLLDENITSNKQFQFYQRGVRRLDDAKRFNIQHTMSVWKLARMKSETWSNFIIDNSQSYAYAETNR